MLVPTHDESQREVPLCERFSEMAESVQRRWESGVDGHLDDDFHELLGSSTHIEISLHVQAELWHTGTQRNTSCCDGDQFPLPEAQAGSCVDVTEGVLDDESPQIGSDVCQGLDDRGTAGPINLLQELRSGLETG